MHSSNGGFLTWIRHPVRGITYMLVISILMLITIFIMNFYFANFILEKDPFEEPHEKNPVVKKKAIPLPFVKIENKEELMNRIDELNTIKASVNKELVGLEKRRQLLLDDLTVYAMKIEKIKIAFDTENTSIDKLRLNRLNIELELDEMKHNNQPQLEAPLKIESAPRSFPQGEFTHSERCTMTTCFDLSQCSLFNHFSIYVYKPATNHYSILSRSIFKHLLSSPYITADATNACVYVYLLEDNIQSSKALNTRLTSLKHWFTETTHTGINHLIINPRNTSIYSLFPRQEKLRLGRAMVAQSSFTFTQYREGFDVVLPPLEEVSRLDVQGKLLPMMVPVRRKHLMTFRGTKLSSIRNSYFSKLISVLTSMQRKYSTDNFHFNFSCQPNHHLKPTTNQDFHMCPSDPLNHSTFSLIAILSHLSGIGDYSISTPPMLTRLMASLKAGAVPVLMAHQASLHLPLNGLVDWTGAVVWLPAARVTELHYYIRSFVDEDIFEMRRRGRLIYERFFSSLPTSINSLLNHLRNRLQIPPPPIHPIPSDTFITIPPSLEDVPYGMLENDEVLGPLEPSFNSAAFTKNFSSFFLKPPSLPNMVDQTHLYPQLPFKQALPYDAKFIGSSFGFRPIGNGIGGAGKEFREALGGDHVREQFTVVMLTYEREAVLLVALSRFKGLPYLNKVVVVWNSPHQPSSNIKWPDIGVKLEVLKMKVNSLNNRFLPFSSIVTEAVLSLDDDVHLRHDEIVFAFRVWRQHRDQLVGFPGRFLSFNKQHNSFFYNSNYSCEMSMVLTGAAFLHKFYLHAYTHLMPADIRTKVDSFINCEDIAMNFLVSHMSRKPPIKVTSRWTFKCPGCPSTLYDDSSHFEERHQCVNAFTAIYGYLPLLTTQYRADSILFKTRISHDKQKCFKYV